MGTVMKHTGQDPSRGCTNKFLQDTRGRWLQATVLPAPDHMPEIELFAHPSAFTALNI